MQIHLVFNWSWCSKDSKDLSFLCTPPSCLWCQFSWRLETIFIYHLKSFRTLFCFPANLLLSACPHHLVSLCFSSVFLSVSITFSFSVLFYFLFLIYSHPLPLPSLLHTLMRFCLYWLLTSILPLCSFLLSIRSTFFSLHFAKSDPLLEDFNPSDELVLESQSPAVQRKHARIASTK